MDESAAPVGAGCHDCGAQVGQLHQLGCDVERCPDCGGQYISCGCGEKSTHRRLAWTGQWPGEAECREFGWYSRWVDGCGWARCTATDPDAGPDLNRLRMGARWDASRGRWVRRGV
jgi:hypothetical protein